MQILFPFKISEQGRCREASEEEHIRNLIEQTLFTSPGERVNRPDFGTSIMDFVFAPASDEIMTATKFMVQGALQQELIDIIQVQDVVVESEDATLNITVKYMLLRDHKEDTAKFVRKLS